MGHHFADERDSMMGIATLRRASDFYYLRGDNLCTITNLLLEAFVAYIVPKVYQFFRSVYSWSLIHCVKCLIVSCAVSYTSDCNGASYFTDEKDSCYLSSCKGFWFFLKILDSCAGPTFF